MYLGMSLGLCALMGAGVGSAGCGEGRVVSGEPAEPMMDSIVGGKPFAGLPAVGALTYYGEQMCTATLVGPRTLLTAAHCVDEAEPAPMRFVIGADVARPDYELPVVELRAHPGFDPRSLVNDIGLVILAADAPVASLPLLEAMDQTWVGTDLFFVGYGVTDGTSGRGAGKKRAVWIGVSCVDPTTFEYDDPGKNTCYGDSGGPAFFVDPAGTTFVAGVTSWGDRRCTQFGVDTRVDVFREFIGEAGPITPSTPASPADPSSVEPSTDAAGTTVVEGVSFTAAEAEAVLDLVNTASEAELDEEVGLDSRAAANIVAARPFITLTELAAVPYVGPTALGKLKRYVGGS